MAVPPHRRNRHDPHPSFRERARGSRPAAGSPRGDPDRRRPRLRGRSRARLRRARATSCSSAAASGSAASTPASARDFLAGDDAPCARRAGRSRRCPPDLLDRRVEITGPGRPEDDHQRAQLRRAASSWPTSRTRTRPTWDNVVEGQANLIDAVARHDRLHRRRTTRQGVPPRRAKTASLIVRPRGWHLLEKHVARRRRRRSRRRSSTSASSSSTTRSELLARGTGPYFYLPKLREPPRGAAAGTTSSCTRRSALGLPRGHDQGDRADRDAPRRLRDGRDPLRAARALGRPQLRPLGLHLQLHQDAPRRPARASCPTARR